MIAKQILKLPKKLENASKSKTVNTDLLTVVFLNTQRINEFLTSYNTNTYDGDFWSFDITFIETSLKF